MQISTSSGAGRDKDTGGSIFPTGKLMAFVLVTAIFFLWGMSNNLTDILVQQFKKSFELSLLQAQLVQTAVFLAYGTMAIPAALLMRKFGYKAGILTGLIVFGTGTLLFWPAAVVGKYAPFLIALFVVGCGSSILETACNPFIAQFGSSGTSERRLNFSQAFNPPGAITGILVGTWFIFSGIEKTPQQVLGMKAAGTYDSYLHSEIMRVVPTYVGLAVVLFLLALLIGRTAFPEMNSEHTSDTGGQGSFKALGRYPQLWFAVIAQFFYVGAQVATWSNFIPYMKQYTTQTEKNAGYFLTGNLIALAAGRVISTWLMQYVEAAKLMRIYAMVNIGLLAFAVLRPGMGGAWTILLTSFFMSIMFPTIFALGVKGLGENTKLGGSLIVMAIVGGAVFPLLMGAVKDATGSLAHAYAIPAIGYVIVGIYGFVGGGVSRTEEMEAPAL
jgi:FHS family L-fucose permease-like MFS transporter